MKLFLFAWSVRKSFVALPSFLSRMRSKLIHASLWLRGTGCYKGVQKYTHVSNVWSMPPAGFFLCLGKSHQRVECRRHSNTESYRYVEWYMWMGSPEASVMEETCSQNKPALVTLFLLTCSVCQLGLQLHLKRLLRICQHFKVMTWECRSDITDSLNKQES